MQKEVLEKLPAYFAALEAFLKQNNGGDGFFVGDSVSTPRIVPMSNLFSPRITNILVQHITGNWDSTVKCKALCCLVFTIETHNMDLASWGTANYGHRH